MNHMVVGTAGHIDHGKSTLVQALTGIDDAGRRGWNRLRRVDCGRGRVRDAADA
jgi:translation initiation factor 2 gamma subunit (eIF-2gamma)